MSVLDLVPGAKQALLFVRASYRRKLAVALLVVFLVGGVAIAGLYLQIGALLDDDVEQSMTAAANAESGEITRWDRQNRLVAQVLSERPVYADGDQAAVREYLRAQRGSRKGVDIGNAYVLDRRNQTVATSINRELEGTSAEELAWNERISFRDFEEVYLSRAYENGDGTAVVAYVTPIRQRPEALLVLTVETNQVFDQFEDPIADGFTRVVDSNGTVVFAGEEWATLRQYRDDETRSPIVNEGLRGESGFVGQAGPEPSAPDERDYVAAYAPVDGTDWVVIKHAPETEAYGLIQEIRTWIGGIGALILAGFVGVVVVLGADVTGSLSRLTARAEKIRDGKYGVEFETDRPDEFGDLNRAFAATRETLRERIEEIEKTRDELEASNTALGERSEMISVLNRILRHNVRNDVNIVAAKAEMLSEEVDDERTREELAVIRTTALDLAAISDRTRRIRQLLAERNTQKKPLDLPEQLPNAIDKVRADRPGSSITFDSDDDAVAVVEGVSTLPTAIADVVEQIIRNNDEVNINITVRSDPVESDPEEGMTWVTIRDDGDGLPEQDVQAVGEGKETPLGHAEGLALWCLEWTVNKADGELVVDCGEVTAEVGLDQSDNAESIRRERPIK